MENNVTELRPTDLISASEAGVMAGKKKDTIRSWVRKGKITGYRKNPSNPTSTLMISTAELRVYLATDATPTHPDNKGRPPTPSASVEEKDKEIALLKKELELSKEKTAMTEQRLEDMRGFHDMLKSSQEDLRTALKSRESEISILREQLKLVTESRNQLQVDHSKSQDDYRRVLAYLSMPWWKRMTKDMPLLTG